MLLGEKIQVIIRAGKKTRISAVVLSCLIWLAGCELRETGYEVFDEGAETAAEPEADGLEFDASEGQNAELEDERWSENRDPFSGEQKQKLLPEQRELIIQYMEAYYHGLASLKTQDMSALFLNTAEDQLLLNESAVDYVTGLRKMQKTDLHLDDYDYELNVTAAETAGDGRTDIWITETSTQNFSQHPEIDTTLYNIVHHFELQDTADGWKIAGHLQWDSIYWNLIREYWDWDSEELVIPEAGSFLPSRVDELLAKAREDMEIRSQQFNSTPKACQYEYDRVQAVAYSSQWVGRRNEEWDDFTGRGGNCQNFVSQCLFAGGIPMDDQGEERWVWNGAEDYSTSWVGVDDFYAYASGNLGDGLMASTDSSYYNGEEGDLICMGSETDWNHIVMISQVVKDEQGNTVDYLINSNTSDVRNFPVGAYPNSYQKLIKIYGWN